MESLRTTQLELRLLVGEPIGPNARLSATCSRIVIVRRGGHRRALCWRNLRLWRGLLTLLTIRMLISPASYADICGDPAGMCCISCAAVGWFTFVPIFGFLFALILFLPGYLFVSWIARRTAG
jgi:hypothetical protein